MFSTIPSLLRERVRVRVKSSACVSPILNNLDNPDSDNAFQQAMIRQANFVYDIRFILYEFCLFVIIFTKICL